MEGMNTFKKNVIFSALTIFILFLALRYYHLLEALILNVCDSITPIFLGLALAYVVNIPMGFLEKKAFRRIKKGRRALSILTAFTIIALILLIVISYILPRFIESVMLLFSSIPEFLEDLREMSSDRWIPYIDKASEYMRPLDKAEAFLAENSGRVADRLFSFLGSVLGVLVTAVLAFVFSLYMLSGKEGILEKVRHYTSAFLGKKRSDGIIDVCTKANSIYKRFFVGQLIEATILGSLTCIGMFILRLPHATVVGVLIGVLAFVPVAGAWIGAIVGMIMIFPISPMKSLVFLVFIILLQWTENNAIYPRVVGSSVGMSGISVLAAITIGGGLGGIFGMLVAVPTTALLYALADEWAEKKINKAL